MAQTYEVYGHMGMYLMILVVIKPVQKNESKDFLAEKVFIFW